MRNRLLLAKALSVGLHRESSSYEEIFLPAPSSAELWLKKKEGEKKKKDKTSNEKCKWGHDESLPSLGKKKGWGTNDKNPPDLIASSATMHGEMFTENSEGTGKL